MASTVHTGGCLCGAVRFAAEGEAMETGYCHCRMCQRSGGAPVQTYAVFPESAFAWTAGEPAAYRSSPDAVREFCPVCGSQLAFRSAGEVSVNTGCFDDPGAFPPERHIWTESRVPWFETTDTLPRIHRG